MFNSIKWRFTIIYFLLIFISLIIAGVFIMQSFEKYHLSGVEEKINDLSNIVVSGIEELNEFDSGDLQKIASDYKKLGFEEEIYILNMENQIIASSTQKINENAINFLDLELLIAADNREEKMAISGLPTSDIRTMDKVIPINIKEQFKGTLYIRYNLSNIYNTLSQTTNIIVKAILITTGITIIICFLIAKTISEPIEDISKKVLLLSEGDFNNKVEVKSDDEIGDLARTFNLLTDKLQFNINEVFKEKNKLETIIEYMTDGLVAINLQGEVIHINSKALFLLNIGEKFIQESVIEKLGIKDILEDKNFIGVKNKKIGDSFLKIDYLPFADDQKNNIGIVFVIRDVTERERLDNMRKEFVANVSHELKTPLTSIRSYSETLIGNSYDEKITKKFLNVINSEANRMGRLVKDLLQLSNFDASFAKLDFQTYDWNEFIENIIFKLKPSYKEKNHKVEFIKSCDYVSGNFDYDRMEQVMINILSNAIKYTPDNGEIEILLECDDTEFIISIKDNGIGIPSEDLAHIFDRFYRVNKARSRKLGGTGLGLAIAKEIVELHQGSLEIESLLDNGTTAILKIPRKIIKV